MLQSIFPSQPASTTFSFHDHGVSSPRQDLPNLDKTNIRSATACNSSLCCHAQSQQWLDLAC